MRTLIAALTVFALCGSAAAACYEDIGCTDSDVFSRADLRPLSCQALWEVRNQIYFENGYCFQTERAIDFFGNDECYVEKQSQVRLSNVERENINRIAAREKQKGCN